MGRAHIGRFGDALKETRCNSNGRAHLALAFVPLRGDCLQERAINALQSGKLLDQEDQFLALGFEIRAQARHQLLDTVAGKA
ncbi:MAG: hypothetical protein E5X64_29270, partial [Mesorhizobium sp.]